VGKNEVQRLKFKEQRQKCKGGSGSRQVERQGAKFKDQRAKAKAQSSKKAAAVGAGGKERSSKTKVQRAKTKVQRRQRHLKNRFVCKETEDGLQV
jgi:hypothetical protein